MLFRLKNFLISLFTIKSTIRVAIGVLLVTAVLGGAIWQGLYNRAEGPSGEDGGYGGYDGDGPAPLALDTLVVSVPTAAGACAPPESQAPFKCQTVLAINPPFTAGIVTKVRDMIYSAESACEDVIIEKLGKQKPPPAPSYEIDMLGAKCSYTFLREGTPSLSRRSFDYKWKLTLPLASKAAKSAYKDVAKDNTENDQLDISGLAKAKGNTTFTYDGTGKVWTRDAIGGSMKELKLDFDGAIAMEMLQKEDLGEFLTNLNSPDQKLVGGSWTIQTDGTVYARVNFSYIGTGVTLLDPPNATIIKQLDFCLAYCTINIGEHLTADLEKTGLTDYISGKVATKQDHVEAYKGKGASTITDGKLLSLKWADLEVGRKHHLEYQTDLTRKSGNANGSTESKWKYNFLEDGQATVLPLIGKWPGKGNAMTVLDRDLTWSECVSRVGPPNNPPSPCQIVSNGTANTAKMTEKREVENGLQTSFTRTGTGNNLTCSDANCDIYSGIYDSDIAEMKVTSSTPPPPNVDTRWSPWSGLDRYTNTYMPVSIPGQFKATDNQALATVIKSKPIAQLPTKIVVFKSWNNFDEPKASQDYNRVKSEVFDKIKVLNPNFQLIELRTDSKASMIAALESLPPDTNWLVNFGHGEPTGIKAGYSDLVSWSTIKLYLEKKQVRLDLFAANSCYAGHSPLAETVIGSLTPGRYGDNYVGIGAHFNDLVGIVSNHYAHNIWNLIKALKQIAGCS